MVVDRYDAVSLECLEVVDNFGGYFEPLLLLGQLVRVGDVLVHFGFELEGGFFLLTHFVDDMDVFDLYFLVVDLRVRFQEVIF